MNSTFSLPLSLFSFSLLYKYNSWLMVIWFEILFKLVCIAFDRFSDLAKFQLIPLKIFKNGQKLCFLVFLMGFLQLILNLCQFLFERTLVYILLRTDFKRWPGEMLE